MNDHDVAILLLLVSGTLFVSTIGFAVAWVRARERLLRERAESAALPDVAAGRAEKLGHAVDSIAIEVERISEGQRFLAKRLGQRHEPGVRSIAEASSPKVITPH
jgi:hypothetical protein